MDLDARSTPAITRRKKEREREGDGESGESLTRVRGHRPCIPSTLVYDPGRKILEDNWLSR